jgi:hypothetical protein
MQDGLLVSVMFGLYGLAEISNVTYGASGLSGPPSADNHRIGPRHRSHTHDCMLRMLLLQ